MRIDTRLLLAIASPVLALALHSLARAEAPVDGSAKALPAKTNAEEERPIDFEPIPDEANPKAPKASDWQSAARVHITRRGPRAEACRAWRVRSWVKIHCDVQTTAAALVAGSAKGVALWVPEPKDSVPAPQAAEVIFPIRPGDRRIFELFSFGETYGGSMVSPGLVLQEYWIVGEPAPTIVLR